MGGELAIARLDDLGDAEVDELHEGLTSAIEHDDVVGFQIAVHHARAVRHLERLGNLRGELERERQGDRPFIREGREGLAVEELHHEVELAIFRAPGIDDVDDVRVTEAAGRHRLAAKALDEAGVFAQLGAHQLERQLAPQLDVRGLVHLAHSTRGEAGVEAVAPRNDPAQRRAFAGLGGLERRRGGRFCRVLNSVLRAELLVRVPAENHHHRVEARDHLVLPDVHARLVEAAGVIVGR